MWLYGSGFPKSHNISKAIDSHLGEERDKGKIVKGCGSNSGESRYNWNNPNDKVDRRYYELTEPKSNEAVKWDGWGTALKPAFEPIVVAMKQIEGTFAENAIKWGVAGLNIDGGKIGTSLIKTVGGRKTVVTGDDRVGAALGYNGPHPSFTTVHRGRWPANLLLDEAAAEMLDEQSGELKGPWGKDRVNTQKSDTSMFKNIGGMNTQNELRGKETGGASRFFYVTKASKAERGEYNDHPTVKPLKLMEYLCTLTKTPKGGIVFDPFMGSGTTIIAALSVGREAIGIDKDVRSVEIAGQRLSERGKK